MWISRYFVYFIIYSFLGWLYESIFCTIKAAKWDNRGFLYGMVCPIYGAGGVAITIVTDLLSGGAVQYDYTWIHVFLVSFFGSIVLEYVTSWGLEKLFHAYWWDYSHLPFNINGRVCLPCSLGFGAAGLLIVYVIAPVIKDATAWITPLGYEIIALVFMCLLSIDATLTIVSLTHFEKAVAAFEENMNTHLEQFVESIVDKTKPAAAAVSGHLSPREMLADGKQSISAKLAEERERFSRESMERVFQSMSRSSRTALRKVKGFRRSKKVDTGHMEAVLTQLKSYLNKKK